MRIGIVAAVLLLIGSACQHFGQPALTVQAEWVFDPQGETLIAGPAEDEEVDRIRTIIASRRDVDDVAWLRASFSALDPSFQKIWEDDLASQEGPSFGHLASGYGGFHYSTETGMLTYRRKVDRLVDGYKQFLSWRTPAGKRLWRRRVPFMLEPVYPLVTPDWVIYLTGWGEDHFVVILSLETGKTLLRHKIHQARSFNFFARDISRQGFLWDGYVVVQPSRLVGNGPGVTSGREWGNITVLKLARDEP